MLLNHFPKLSGTDTIRITKRPVTPTVEGKVALSEIVKVSEQAAKLVSAKMIDKDPLTPDSPSFNNFNTEPVNIPLDIYIKRVLRLTKSSPQCALMAVIYLERMVKIYPKLEISQLNVRRLMFTAMLISSKTIHDIPYNNKFWKAISGTYTLEQVNKMEIDMIVLLDWKVFVEKKDLDRLSMTKLN